MDLFFTKIDKKYNNLDKIALSKLQHKLARKLLDYLLKVKFGIIDEVLVKNGKPYLKNNPIYFNISHSKYLIGILFDSEPVGLDIEYKRKRNYRAILDYLNFNKDVSEEEFFQLWTVYEAEFKSGLKEDIISFDYENYSVSISYRKMPSGMLNIYFLKEQDNKFLMNKVENPVFLKNLDYKLKP